MKTRGKLLNYFVLLEIGFSLNTFAQSTAPSYAVAGEVQRYFSNQQNNDFNYNLTLEAFQKVSPKDQLVALADLIAHPDHESNDRDDAEVYAPDRVAIMQRYYDNLSQQQKDQVQAMAFDLSLHYVSTKEQLDQAEKYYQKLLDSNPQAAMQRLCSAVSVTASQSLEGDRGTKGFDDEKPQLRIRTEVATMFISYAAKVPQMLDQGCQVKIDNRIIKYSPRDVIYASGESYMKPELEYAMKNAKENVIVQQIISKEYSSCSDKQLRIALSDAIVAANSQKVGTKILFSRTIDNCIVDARITRLATGYDFAPRAEIRGYKNKTIPFQNLNDIVSKLKMQPQSFAINRVQEVRVSSQAAPTPVYEEPATQSKPAEETNWKEILINPWGAVKDASGKVRDLFGR